MTAESCLALHYHDLRMAVRERARLHVGYAVDMLCHALADVQHGSFRSARMMLHAADYDAQTALYAAEAYFDLARAHARR